MLGYLTVGGILYSVDARYAVSRLSPSSTAGPTLPEVGDDDSVCVCGDVAGMGHGAAAAPDRLPKIGLRSTLPDSTLPDKTEC